MDAAYSSQMLIASFLDKVDLKNLLWKYDGMSLDAEWLG